MNGGRPKARVAVVGVGLIGGSLGMALRRAGFCVDGLDVRSEVLARAVERGAIDRGSTDSSAVSLADIILLACPLDRIVTVAAEIGPFLKPGCLVTDVGSVKAPIVQGVEDALPRSARFVGGHPMFGTAGQGIEAADAALLERAPFLFTPTSSTDPDAVDELDRLARLLGMSPHRLSPQEHDEQLAVLSHLPYLIATALTRLATRVDAAGPAFREMTRVAQSPTPMWRSILSLNREAVSAALGRFTFELEQLALLEGDPLEAALEHTRQARSRMFPKVQP